MRRILISKPGGPETLTVVEAESPTPAADEVVIQVAVSGVNYADTLQRRGTYPVPVQYPFVPGSEVAGTSKLGFVRGLGAAVAVSYAATQAS